MQRLTKTAGILDTLLRVLYWILVVAAIIAACGCVLSFISHLVDLEETSPIFGIDLDFLTLELADNVIPPETASKVQQAVSLASMVCLIAGAALGAYCIQLLRTILQPMKEGQPFQSSVGADLKKLAWLVGEQIANVNSDDITQADWLKLARRINELSRQNDIAGFEVRFQAFDLAGAGNRNDIRFLADHPGQGKLCLCAVFLRRHGSQQIKKIMD